MLLYFALISVFFVVAEDKEYTPGTIIAWSVNIYLRVQVCCLQGCTVRWMHADHWCFEVG